MGKRAQTALFITAAVGTAVLTCLIGAWTLRSHLQAAGLQAPWPSAQYFAIDEQGIAAPVNADDVPAAAPEAAAPEPSAAQAPAPAPAPAEPRAPPPPPAPPTPQPDPGPAVLYYGKGCPHCDKVLAYLGSEEVRDKIHVAEKEVFNDKANADEMMDRAKSCNLSVASLGVPFLWTGSSCLSGDGPIIDFFKGLAEAK